MSISKLNENSYDKLASSPTHLFFSRVVEMIVSNINPNGPKWWAILDERIDIEWYAKKKKAKDMKHLLRGFPGNGLNVMHWRDRKFGPYGILEDTHEDEGDLKNDAKDEIYLFECSVYAGTLLFVDNDFGRVIVTRCNFVAGPDKNAVDEFKNSYLKDERERNKRVLDYQGYAVSSFRQMEWSGIFLADKMGEEIRKSCESFFKSKDMYIKNMIDWKLGILLIGPPGNGKTAVCRALATSIGMPVIYCNMTDAEPYSMITSLPHTIRINAPCVLMVEDVDAMTGNESLRAGFLNIIDGLTGVSGVLTVASTNSPDKLDPAFSSRPSRFDELYLFRNPDDKMREKILRNKLGDDAKDRFDIPHLVQETNGFSAAFVQEVVVKAMREAFLSGKQVTSTLLRNSVKKVRKHVTDSSENWTGRIGFS
jgi:hypothetical protein